jgi:peroxiredoxin Q/BCP
MMTIRRALAVGIALGYVCVTPLDLLAQEQSRRAGSRQAVLDLLPPDPPKVGVEAPEFTLKNLKDEAHSLTELTKAHTVVLLVLRGWPGYQCPLCTRQVGEFLEKEAEFARLGAKVVMVYPGPAELIADHAKEFQGEREFPPHFVYLVDPDYVFTKAWGLRWNADGETAYPSTFIIGKDRQVKFGVTSTTHGDRAAAATVLGELAKLAE